MAEQLTLNQWVLGSSPRGRTSKKIPLILRNRRDFCVPSEKILLGLRYRYFPLLWCSMLGRRYSPSFLQGTRPRFASDTLMSLRAIPSFLAWLPGARQRIYAPLRVSVLGVRCGPVGVAVDSRWFSVCAPCLANWGGGGCRLLVCCLVAGVLHVGRGRLSRFGVLRGG